MKPDDLSANRLAIDVRQADDLRLKLKQSPREGLKQVAQQFESLFIGMMLKSMRHLKSFFFILGGLVHSS